MKVNNFLYRELKVKCTSQYDKFVGAKIDNRNEDCFLHEHEMISIMTAEWRIEKIYDVPMV